MLEIVVGAVEKDLLAETGLAAKDNIIDFSLLLSIGQIRNVQECSNRIVCGYNINVKEKIEELSKSISQNNNVRIWYSGKDNEDVCTLYFLVKYLSGINNLNIYVCDVLSEKTFSDIEQLLENSKKLTQKEIEAYKEVWNDLEAENGELRILNDGLLKSYSYDYLDEQIIEMLKNHNSVSYFEFVGECLRKRLCGFHMDVIFINRIDEIIKNKKIEVCEIKQERDFLDKIVNKKYIRVVS